jgi:hypothetical protein
MDTFAKFIERGPQMAHLAADERVNQPLSPTTSSRTMLGRHIALRFEPMRTTECTLVMGMR